MSTSKIYLLENDRIKAELEIAKPATYSELTESLSKFNIQHFDVNITSNENIVKITDANFEESEEYLIEIKEENLSKTQIIYEQLSASRQAILDEKIICSICYERLFHKPYYCYKCQKLYCGKCFEKYSTVEKSIEEGKFKSSFKCKYCYFELDKSKWQKLINFDSKREFDRNELMLNNKKLHIFNKHKYNNLCGKYEELRAEYENAVRDNNESKERINEMEKTNKELGDLNLECKEKLREGEEKNEGYKRKIVELVKEKQGLEDKVKSMESNIREYRDKIEYLEQFNTESRSKIIALESSIDTYRKEIISEANTVTKQENRLMELGNLNRKFKENILYLENRNKICLKESRKTEENYAQKIKEKEDVILALQERVKSLSRENVFYKQIQIRCDEAVAEKEDRAINRVTGSTLDYNECVLLYETEKSDQEVKLLSDEVNEICDEFYCEFYSRNKSKITLVNLENDEVICDNSYVFKNKGEHRIKLRINEELSNFSGMFWGCTDLKEIIGDIDVSKCTDFSYMFCECDSLINIDALKNWDVRKGESFAYNVL